MIHFANPYLLYLLLLIPVIAMLYVWAKITHRRKLARFGRKEVLSHLMPDASRYMPNVKIILELMALAFVIVAIARPYVDKTGKISQDDEETTSGIEVMICLDVSNSMLASSTEDPAGVSRLQRAKHILEKMIDKMGNDKVGLIVFAGEAYTQLPITTDFISAKMFINSLTPDAVPTQGTAIGAALDMAINSFNPESEFQKAIVLITDGENFEDDATGMAQRAADAGIEVDVIGVGTEKGMPIPVNNAQGKYLLDMDGQQVLTAFNPTIAEEIVKAGKGIYIAGGSNSAINELNEQLSKLSKTEYKRHSSPSAASELFPIAALIALCLLLIDLLLPYSKISWLKNINFFSKK